MALPGRNRKKTTFTSARGQPVVREASPGAAKALTQRADLLFRGVGASGQTGAIARASK